MVVKCKFCGTECNTETVVNNICPNCGAALPVLERYEEMRVQEEKEKQQEHRRQVDFEKKKQDRIVYNKLRIWIIAATFAFIILLFAMVPVMFIMIDHEKNQSKQHELRTGYYEYIRIYYYYDEGTWYYYDEHDNVWVTEASYTPEWLNKTNKIGLYEQSVDDFKEDYPEGVRFKRQE